jgi:hypothetical protein
MQFGVAREPPGEDDMVDGEGLLFACGWFEVEIRAAQEGLLV